MTYSQALSCVSVVTACYRSGLLSDVVSRGYGCPVSKSNAPGDRAAGIYLGGNVNACRNLAASGALTGCKVNELRNMRLQRCV